MFLLSRLPASIAAINRINYLQPCEEQEDFNHSNDVLPRAKQRYSLLYDSIFHSFDSKAWYLSLRGLLAPRLDKMKALQEVGEAF